MQGTVLHGIVHQLLLLHDGLHTFPSQRFDLWEETWCFGDASKIKASLMLSAYFFLPLTLFSRQWQQTTVICTYVQSPSRLRQLNLSMRVCTSGCNKAALLGLVCMHPVNRVRAAHLMQTHLSEEVHISETLSQQQDVSVPALLGAPA